VITENDEDPRRKRHDGDYRRRGPEASNSAQHVRIQKQIIAVEPPISAVIMRAAFFAVLPARAGPSGS
jgi:hypothetical protein